MDGRPVACCPAMGEHLQDNADECEGIEYSIGGGIPSGFYCWGCCHGGCFVLGELRYCPWCAAPLRLEVPYDPA